MNSLEKTNLHRVTWVVKVSKFCNLRCAYCYEWEDLAKRDRMPLSLWRNLFNAMRDFHQIQISKGNNPVTKIVLHGGEPLALPIDYLNKVAAIYWDTLGEDLSSSEFQLGVQTNLYRISDEQIKWIIDNHISLGVSFDYIPGIRISANGKNTEDDVLHNLERITNLGIPFGAITVLAKHTSNSILEIYDFFAEKKIPWRVLPLFDGPDSRPLDRFSVSHDEIVNALEALFVYWIETGVRIPVAPLMEHFENTLRKMVGVFGLPYDRRIDGEGVFVVNYDGSLYRILDGYNPTLRLGNVSEQSMQEIIKSTQYLNSLIRDDLEREKYCSKCEFHGACNGWPIFASRQSGNFQGRCPISYRIHLFMENYLQQMGFNEAKLRQMLLSILDESTERYNVEEQLVSI